MINQLHTSCRDCAFAKYDKSTQVGCDFDRIESYKESGAEVLEAYDENGKEFYVINDRVCIYHRSKEWAKKYPTAELKNIVNAQCKVPFHAIIVHKKGQSLEELESTISSLSNQFNPPTIVSVVNKELGESIYKTNMAIEEIFKKYEESFKWRIQNILDEEKRDRECIDLTIDATYFSFNYPYYITFFSGFSVPEEFTKELHDAVLVNNKQVIVGYGIDKTENCMLVNKIMHRKHTGNAFLIDVEHKILELEEDSEKYFYNIEELCPCVQS